MIAAAPSRRQNGKLRPVPIQQVSINDILPSSENEELYQPVDPADPEIVELACSVKAHGVQEPLILTADHFIVSGHRRLVAAKLAGLAAVPCKMLDLRRIMLDTFGGRNGVETSE